LLIKAVYRALGLMAREIYLRQLTNAKAGLAAPMSRAALGGAGRSEASAQTYKDAMQALCESGLVLPGGAGRAYKYAPRYSEVAQRIIDVLTA
jgi:hypothetical protein